MTCDDLDLYYGHKAQEMILTDVSDTIHADSFALFALNIEILLADVTKPEKSKILTLQGRRQQVLFRGRIHGHPNPPTPKIQFLFGFQPMQNLHMCLEKDAEIS